MNKKEGLDYAKEILGLDMSEALYFKIYKPVLRLKDLTALEKLVICMIKSFTDEGKEFKMSNNRIGFELGISSSSASRLINKLEDKGIIRATRNKEKGKSHNTVRNTWITEESLEAYNI